MNTHSDLKVVTQESFHLPLSEQVEEKKETFFKLSSPRLYHFFLFLCVMIPSMFVIYMFSKALPSEKGREILWISPLLMTVGFLIIRSLVKDREKKIQLSFEMLLKKRFEEVRLEHASFSESPAYLQEIEELKLAHENHVNLLQIKAAQNKEHELQLSFELEKRENQIDLLREDLEKNLRALKDAEYQNEFQKDEFNSALKHKESLIYEYLETIKEQRKVLEKKQRTIAKLEDKVHDLNYEIRSLLQLEESSPAFAKSLKTPEISFTESITVSSPLDTPPAGNFDLSLILKRYLKIAEIEVGIGHLGYVGGKTPRFLDISLEHSLTDIRSLFDKFKDNKIITILIDPLELKVLYANSAVRELLGWPQEKFSKEFFEVSQVYQDDWASIFKKLQSQGECFFKAKLKSKDGHEILLKAHMGMIAHGPYTHLALAIFSL